MDIKIVQSHLGKKVKIGLRSGAFYSGSAQKIQSGTLVLYDKLAQLVYLEITDISSLVNITDNPRPYGVNNEKI